MVLERPQKVIAPQVEHCVNRSVESTLVTILERPVIVSYFVFWLPAVVPLVDVKHGPHSVDVGSVVASGGPPSKIPYR